MIRSNVNLCFIADERGDGASMFNAWLTSPIPRNSVACPSCPRRHWPSYRLCLLPCHWAYQKLTDIAVHVLFQEVAEVAVIAAFQCGPEEPHPVRMRLHPDILADAVIKTLMRPVHTHVGGSVIHMDLCIWVGLFMNKAMQCLSVLCPEHGGFADCSASCTILAQLPSLGVAHVLPLATDVVLVNLNRARKLTDFRLDAVQSLCRRCHEDFCVISRSQ